MDDQRFGSVRTATQAGRFYEADPEALRAQIQRMLEQALPIDLEHVPYGLLAPHAGYLFSGSVAASAFRCVRGESFDGVIVLAPSHYRAFEGVALASHEAFATPLGRVPVDAAAVAELKQCPGFLDDNSVHTVEHALEVELPFLQVALTGEVPIVPVLVGSMDGNAIDRTTGQLQAFINRRAKEDHQRWLVVASSDTYHGYDPDECRKNDQRLRHILEHMDTEQLCVDVRRNQVMACGWAPLALVMELSRRRGATRGVVLDRSDSQQGALGSGSYVVGYVAAAFV